jgi:predicted nucleic acid-binding protein
VRVEVPDRELVLEAAHLKIRGWISYADCFAIATARRHGAPLLTGDREIVQAARDLEVVDLRRAARA